MDERTRAVAKLWTRALPNVSAFVARALGIDRNLVGHHHRRKGREGLAFDDGGRRVVAGRGRALNRARPVAEMGADAFPMERLRAVRDREGQFDEDSHETLVMGPGDPGRAGLVR